MTTPQRDAPDHDSWPAFVQPWDDTSTGPADVSFLLEKPAGVAGFIRADDGHLATGDGRRWRLWGVGMVFASWFPSLEQAETVARRLAKFGVNCLRLHHLDHRWPNGILKRYTREELAGERADCLVPGAHYPHPGRQSTRELDPEAMARLDWFIACCKAHGIYVDFNLNVTRRFSAADGVSEAEGLGYAKGLTYFDERLVALQREYASNLLTHVNPFTGNRYADEPAVALVELLNENSLLDVWHRGRLEPADDLAAAQGPRDLMPASYAADLEQRWNGWLAGRYADRGALLAAWRPEAGPEARLETSPEAGSTSTEVGREGPDGSFGLRDDEDPAQGTVRRLRRAEFGRASTARFVDEARFLAEIERSFFTEMAAYLRNDLGVKQLLVPTSDWVHGYSGLPTLETNADLDVIDGHAYWQPLFARKTFANTPQLDEPDSSLVARLSRSAIEGRPYIVSEINESFPNDFAAEAIPLLAAYGCLQDWDGFFWHSYTGGHYDWDAIWQEPSVPHHLRLCSDPLKMSQLAAGALLFLRGDVGPARETVSRRYPYDWILNSTRTRSDLAHPYWLPHLPGRLALTHRTRVADFHAAAVAPPAGAVRLAEDTIRSDTGELTWEDEPGSAWWRADAPRHQALVMRAGRQETTHLVVVLRTPFASIQVVSLDDSPVAEAAALLLVAVARVANTGMRWNDSRTGIEPGEGGAVGGRPTRIEPVQARVTLRGLSGDVGAVRLWPLDGRGQPMGDGVEATRTGAGYELELTGERGTTWYTLQVRR